MKRTLRFSRSAAAGLCLFLLVFVARSGWAQIPDPAAPGPLSVTRIEYNFGDSAFFPFVTRGSSTLWPGPVELNASVHYPTGLPGGPYPLIVFMHGRHSTSYLPTGPGTGTSASLQWPPVPPRATIPSYQGYDYISQILASHGYIVISIGVNGVNAQDNNTPDRGMYARSQVLQKHLDIWKAFSTVGSVTINGVTADLSQFIGKVDLNNVGTMGHSRGGEGVAHHYVDNVALGSPYKVRAVLPLAPVDFNRFIPTNVPLFVILPYCDGDVSDLQGAKFYDDARYFAPGDPTAKHMLTVMGANHNYFNTIWTPGLFAAGTSDDWGTTRDPFANPTIAGNSRLTPAQQRSVGAAYMVAFFRAYIGGETQFLPILKGDAPPPPSSQSTFLFTFFHAPDQPNSRLDVNRFLDPANLTLNSLGGLVTKTGPATFDVVGGDAPPQPQLPLVGQPGARQPHNAASSLSTRRGLAQLKMSWSGPGASLTNELPGGTGNVSGYQTLQFRAAVNFQAYTLKPLPQSDFSVILTDGAGNSASTTVGQWSKALYFPPGKLSPLPKVLLHTIRIPLSAFTGVNKSDIRSVRFAFDRQPNGALLIADIAFADPGVAPTEFAPFALPPLGGGIGAPALLSSLPVSAERRELVLN